MSRKNSVRFGAFLPRALIWLQTTQSNRAIASVFPFLRKGLGSTLVSSKAHSSTMAASAAENQTSALESKEVDSPGLTPGDLPVFNDPVQ
ncbi:MAG TPA: hypothetical protein V6D03_11335, partial [Candidatus Caenarcaniphilales bacterium]